MASRKTTRDLENVGLKTNTNQEVRSISQHVPKSSTKQVTDPTIPGHIYFLIREQAKSLVAIKSLNQRVRSLEGVQDDVCQAVNGLQFQMDRSLQDMVKAKLYPSSKSDDGIPAKVSINHQCMQSRSGRIVPAGNVEDSKKDHSESDSKQDSGLDSDCQVHASLPATKKMASEGDELLDLLDVIAQKGSGLWKRVEECERLKVLEEEETHEALSSQDAAGLLQTCRSLQRRLGVAEREKVNLASQLVYVERVARDIKSENSLLEERLEAVTRDKKKLESQIHRLHSQFVSCKENSSKVEPNSQPQGGVEQKPKKLGRLRNNEESRNRVAAILKETNVLELQKQLLTYIVENEVLTAKFEHLELMRMSTAAEIEKTESRMQSELQQLLKERNDLQEAMEDSKRERTALQAKTKMLERVLQAVSQDSNQSASLDACVTSVRSQPSPHGSHLKQSRLQLLSSSLPPVLMPGMEHYVHEIPPIGDTSAFMNISGDGRLPDMNVHNSPVSTTNNNNLRGYRWSSTPIRSRFEAPGFGSFSKLSVPLESSKEVKTSQSQTCLNEFDPLYVMHRENHSGGRMSDFVDSLDLTPTKIFEVPMSKDSPNAIKMPLAQMGNISFPRTPFVRQSQRALRFPDSIKRRSDSCVQAMLHQVDEALL